MSGPKAFTQVVIQYLPTLWEWSLLSIRCKLFERRQAFKVTSADDRTPVASSFGEYRRILTGSLKLRILRKIQLMRTSYFLLGEGVENIVIFLPFPTLFGDIHAGCLFLFSCVL
jgi:hypothetical protein